jgi:hypothetical protein
MQFKTTTKLFRGIYQYKIVLVCPGAQWFRCGDMSSTLEQLKKVNLDSPKASTWRNIHIKTPEDLDYAFKLQSALSKMNDIDVRVETPWITIYTNNKKYITTLTNLDKNQVKYVSAPPANTTLTSNTIIMPKMNYDFRITLGKTSYEHSAFISWAETNSKVKLTKSCVRDLSKTRSWGGTHFYITGDNNLLMVKMQLGDSIAKIERIVKK